MSSHQEKTHKRLSVKDIARRKKATPLVALTAYHAHTAKLLDDHVDIILVGDSLGMVMHGMETTVPVTLDMMCLQAKAVMRGARKAFIVVDLPFGSYEESPQQAFRSASKVMKETGCHAIKLEGGSVMAETIAFLTQRGVPVMAHIGLTPQSIHTMGGFKIQGRIEAEWAALEKDARAIEEAGAFAVVLEGMAEPIAAKITHQLSIPTIGIGASAECDGQILVLEDILGLSERPPKFVKQYADLGTAIDKAVSTYAMDVREKRFPSADQTYTMRKQSNKTKVKKP